MVINLLHLYLIIITFMASVFTFMGDTQINIDAALAFLKIALRRRRKTQQNYRNYLSKQKKNKSYNT